MIRLLHLSDIHFSPPGAPAAPNLEAAVRERMVEDISRMRDELGEMQAVLVVGDIAGRGAPADYRLAGEFLDNICDLIGCERDQVVCVPGNHDIDWTAHLPLHEAVRHRLRSLEAPHLSDALARLLVDEAGSEVLLKPFVNYNSFALQYRCAISREFLVWKPKTMDLDGRELQLHGITSCWISDASDSHETDEHKLVLGLFQFAGVAGDASAIHMALCHHPMRWLRDRDQVESWAARPQLFLTGHEHEAGIVPSGDGRSLHIASGAVNPNREEEQDDAPWIPAYNVIELEIPEAKPESLHVTVHVRTWQAAHRNGEVGRAEFGPNPERAVVEHDLPLETPAPADVSSLTLPTDVATKAVIQTPEPIESDARAMMYRIMRSAPDRRRAVARELMLLTSEATGLDADRELLARAVQQDRLQELDERLQTE